MEVFGLVFAIAVVGVLFVAFVALMLVLRAALWVALLPFRLLFAVLTLPLLLLKGLILSIGAVLGFGLLAIAGVVIVGGLILAVVVPLLPILFIVAVTWALVRLMRRPALA